MAATHKTPKSRPETLERRRDILRAALDTFGAKGFNKAPLSEIAEQVGMTHAGILHHFGSKNQLLLEVLKFRDQSDVEEFEGHHMPGGLGLFRHLVRTAFKNTERAGIVQAYAVLSAESVTDDHPAKQFFEDRYAGLRADVREAFATVCRERGLDPDDARIAQASASIIAVMDGLQVQWLLARDDVELAQASAFAIEAIVAQVLSPQPDPLAASSDEGGVRLS